MAALSELTNNYSNHVTSNGYSESKQPETESPTIDIVINNVVCSFNVKCHLNLREIATSGCNVEYRKENGVSNRAAQNAGAQVVFAPRHKSKCSRHNWDGKGKNIKK